MSDARTIWVPDEDQEKEILELRERVTTLEKEVTKWRAKFDKERRMRLRIGAEYCVLRRPPGPKLYTCRDPDGKEHQVWMYVTDTITAALDMHQDTFRKDWIHAGIIPDSDYRSINTGHPCPGKRLWSRDQVEVIVEVMTKFWIEAPLQDRSKETVRREILARWKSIGSGTAKRSKVSPNFGELPKVIRGGKRGK